MQFILGQRWISHTESQLGLGIVVDFGNRRVDITFPAADEQRTYATDNAPLSRVIYKIGDTVSDNDDKQYTVVDLLEHNGLIIYKTVDNNGEQHALPELELSSFVQFSNPQERLYSGQIERPRAFKLRYKTLNRLQHINTSSARGLLGARVSMLPHQIYIASEVGQRYAPRVLLADEVGLGKTIEAGMIIHQQIISGRASRVLIVVPDTLIHQWLVEMLRRFNLQFSVFDAERCEALDDSSDNPFDSSQLILCSLNFLQQHPVRLEQAKTAHWDLLVVDEAHHLHWTPEQPSDAYLCIEQLAEKSKGLLLLTATPEQLGIESHFARLRLLDPARFYDVEKFRGEEQHFQALNQVLQNLLNSDEQWVSDSEILTTLKQYISDDELQRCLKNSAPTQTLIDTLLDHHGTGRVLFRNTRAAIKGFPDRQVFSYPLSLPSEYLDNAIDKELDTKELLNPEIAYSYQSSNNSWTEIDPRVSWLATHLKTLKREKVLVICAQASTAIELEEYLRLRCGVKSADFHEGLSIIERDRAAAYFGDKDDGAQVLICSEIGSEGRNFQFAQHLIMFDLPLNPDLLEQRIGRLDRIGQTNTIHIHVPYFENSAQEVLFHWYHRALQQFEQTFAGGQQIFEANQETVLNAIKNPSSDYDPLIESVQQQAQALRVKLQQGRDQLLELNSCRPEIAQQQIDAIQATEASDELADYMETIFDLFGVEHEFHSEDALILHPGDHMLTSAFPMLPEDGTTVTFERDKALSREDMQFLSWEHPMISGAMDLVMSSEIGNNCVCKMKLKGLKPGTLLMEAIYQVGTVAPLSLQLQRFLPVTPVRIVLDIDGRNLTAILKHDTFINYNLWS